MIRLFPAALLILPLAEIAGFILVGRAIGVLATLALVVLSTLVGLMLLRAQRVRVSAALRGGMRDMTAPRLLGDAAYKSLAGVLLLIPGFVTDAVGLLLLLPPVRALIRLVIGRWWTVSATVYTPPDPGQRSIELDGDDWHRR